MVDIPTHRAVFESAVPESLLAHEHLVLVRRLACLQQQMTLLVRTHEAQLHHWQYQLMLQSVRLLLERTRIEWDLVPRGRQTVSAKPGSTVLFPDPGLAQTLASAQTDALICRTGCQMDIDHWRDGDLCKRNGRSCAASVPAVDASQVWGDT